MTEHMTDTEKKYLTFLSPRTPRPKSCDRPSPKILKRMMDDYGWIAAGPANKFGMRDYHITPAGEQALTRHTSPGVHMKSDVMWREVGCMPEGHTCLITDGTIVRTGVREGDTMVAGVVTPLDHWTHWAAMPMLPLSIMFIRDRDA